MTGLKARFTGDFAVREGAVRIAHLTGQDGGQCPPCLSDHGRSDRHRFTGHADPRASGNHREPAAPQRAHRAAHGSRGRLRASDGCAAGHARQRNGFTLVELLVAVSFAAVLIAGLTVIMGQISATRDVARDRSQLTREARFAIEQMVRTVSHSRLLLLPQHDKPGSNWPEHIREQTVPPSPPLGDSTLATAVLAVTLPAYQDLDADGFADADDDRDGLIDEDLPADSHNDAAAGIYLIDDGGNGAVDDGPVEDDDEALSTEGEDPINGLDDDDDGSVDEDPPADMNADGCPGICGVDDDEDSSIDGGGVDDDDEDGLADEDWYNAVVFYLDNGALKLRTPVPWDENGSAGITGRDFITSDLVANVSRFRVERIGVAGSGAQLVDLTLELTGSDSGERVRLQTRVRVGGAL